MEDLGDLRYNKKVREQCAEAITNWFVLLTLSTHNMVRAWMDILKKVKKIEDWVVHEICNEMYEHTRENNRKRHCKAKFKKKDIWQRAYLMSTIKHNTL